MRDGTERISVRVHPKMRWECVQCGSCCSNIGVKEWFDRSLEDELDLLDEQGCRFLEFKQGRSRCTRYDSRPGACRRYPFLISTDGQYHWLSIHSKCKGISVGENIDVPKIFMKVLKLVENDLGIQYMVEADRSSENRFRLYKVV